MALDSTPTPRRAVLGAALGGLAALGASALGRPTPSRAAAGQAVIQGQVNNAGATTTTVTSTKVGDAALVGQASDPTGRGVYGKAIATSGINVGVFGTTASASGRGVFGKATKTSGSGQGVRGEVVSPNGYGVYGKAATTAGDGAAVRADGGINNGVDATTTSDGSHAISGRNTSGIGQPVGIYGYGSYSGIRGHGSTYGVLGFAFSGSGLFGDSGSGIGVEGYSSTGIGIKGFAGTVGSNAVAKAVFGYTASEQGIGVHGQATAGTGSTLGVKGEVSSSGGVGIYGAGPGMGVNGHAFNPGGFGVFGQANNGSGTNYGVWGQATAGYAVYAAGNAHVTGTLSKAGGSFRIDHPLDPANRYLQHSFVESPDMKNIYDGVARLDGRGEAVVALPDWFEALNRDFRYQLTAIGAAASPFVRTKLSAGRFTIAGGAAGQEISWQVTGIRRDAWAEAHRIEVDVEKSADDRGRYLHPLEHGRTIERGIDHGTLERSGRLTPPD